MSRNQNKPEFTLDSASFRDPDGFIFYHQGRLYRHINVSYQKSYQKLESSGLLATLHGQNLLIPHQEVNQKGASNAYKIIKPEIVPFISYPFSWCFSQFKDAALLTLAIQKLSLAHGMSLKDASAYNIQFHHGRPILIDTLSFEPYREGEPWIAYHQFCCHFLAPLALMAHTDVRLTKLLRFFIDGIPLDLASRILPKKTYLNPGLAIHLHLHAHSQQKYAHKTIINSAKTKPLAKHELLGLIDSLTTTVQKLSWKYSAQSTTWGNYYANTNYSTLALTQKQHIVERWLNQVNPKEVWDLGANDGRFSRLATQKGIPTIAFDIDPVSVEKNYLAGKQNRDTHMLPLVVDLTNPPPSLGWANSERKNLLDRGPTGMVLALALVHHLSITHNVPLPHLASFMARIGKHLIIEFVPSTDSKVKLLLANKKVKYSGYTQKNFESAFASHFRLLDKHRLPESQRTLYLYQAKPIKKPLKNR